MASKRQFEMSVTYKCSFTKVRFDTQLTYLCMSLLLEYLSEVCACCVPVSVVQLCVGVCVCLSASVGRSMDVRRPCMCPFQPQHGSCVHNATHLPNDKEDECSTQHQGEHVAEGRKGERHGRASQPDDEMG